MAHISNLVSKLSRARIIALMVVLSMAPWASSQPQMPDTAAGADAIGLPVILANMAEHNRRRNQYLHAFSVDREYSVDVPRVGKSALMKASMLFVAPDEKLFEIHSYSGIKLFRTRVINRIIETERESARSPGKARTAITPENYNFELLQREVVDGRLQYILRAQPRFKDGILFDGKIWVDAEDFAVTRIEAKPAKNPSFWTRRVDIIQEYQRLGSYWFPARNISVARIFLFGKATTQIKYVNYRINEPDLASRAKEMRQQSVPLEVQVDAKDAKK